MICERSRFKMAELWSFGSGSLGLDGSGVGDKIQPKSFTGLQRSLTSMAALTRTKTQMSARETQPQGLVSDCTSAPHQRSSSFSAPGPALTRSLTCMTASARTTTQMSAFAPQSLSYTGVGYTDPIWVAALEEDTRNKCGGQASSKIEKGCAREQARADECAPAHRNWSFPWICKDEKGLGLLALMDQKRSESLLSCGQGLAGAVCVLSVFVWGVGAKRKRESKKE